MTTYAHNISAGSLAGSSTSTKAVHGPMVPSTTIHLDNSSSIFTETPEGASTAATAVDELQVAKATSVSSSSDPPVGCFSNLINSLSRPDMHCQVIEVVRKEEDRKGRFQFECNWERGKRPFGLSWLFLGAVLSCIAMIHRVRPDGGSFGLVGWIAMVGAVGSIVAGFWGYWFARPLSFRKVLSSTWIRVFTAVNVAICVEKGNGQHAVVLAMTTLLSLVDRYLLGHDNYEQLGIRTVVLLGLAFTDVVMDLDLSFPLEERLSTAYVYHPGWLFYLGYVSLIVANRFPQFAVAIRAGSTPHPSENQALETFLLYRLHLVAGCIGFILADSPIGREVGKAIQWLQAHEVIEKGFLILVGLLLATLARRVRLGSVRRVFVYLAGEVRAAEDLGRDGDDDVPIDHLPLPVTLGS